jgi:hypothetical protein
MSRGHFFLSSRKGALWVRHAYRINEPIFQDRTVAGHDTVLHSMQEKHNLLPMDVGNVSLARTMDEKCEILKSMGVGFSPGWSIMIVRHA